MPAPGPRAPILSLCAAVLATFAALWLPTQICHLPAAGADDEGTAQKAYKWYEAEKTLKAQGWGTSDFWEPSAGLFLYQLGDLDTARTRLAVPLDDWVVWMRVRDETQGLRQATATVNGMPSYVMGGANVGAWIWYAVGFAHDSSLDIAYTDISPGPWDSWVDALLVTNDLTFVPPGRSPSPDGYTAYKSEEDAEKGRRLAWIWWPNQPEPGTNGFYRKRFELRQTPTKAALLIQALGRYIAHVNDLEVGSGVEVGKPASYDVAEYLQEGANVIGVQLTHEGFLPGLKVLLELELPDGGSAHVVSDLTWRATNDVTAAWSQEDSDDDTWHRPWARISDKDRAPQE